MYFLVERVDQKASCVICCESVVVSKEYNLQRHYIAKHPATYSVFWKASIGEILIHETWLRNTKCLFTVMFAEDESVTRTSYKIVQKIAERENYSLMATSSKNV